MQSSHEEPERHRHSGYAEFINKYAGLLTKEPLHLQLTELQKTDLNMRIEVVKVNPERLYGQKTRLVSSLPSSVVDFSSWRHRRRLLGKMKLNTGHLVCDFPPS